MVWLVGGCGSQDLCVSGLVQQRDLDLNSQGGKGRYPGGRADIQGAGQISRGQGRYPHISKGRVSRKVDYCNIKPDDSKSSDPMVTFSRDSLECRCSNNGIIQIFEGHRNFNYPLILLERPAFFKKVSTC